MINRVIAAIKSQIKKKPFCPSAMVTHVGESFLGKQICMGKKWNIQYMYFIKDVEYVLTVRKT